MKRLLLSFLLMTGASVAMAQSYNPKVSKDSLGILNAKADALKANTKIIELKIKEAEEELEVEDLRVKLLEAKNTARESSEKASRNMDKSESGKTVDLKSISKFAKKAKSDGVDAEKALERFNKQIEKVEDLRTDIQSEERKIGYKKPQLVYDYK